MSQTVALRGFPGFPCEVRLEFQVPLPRNLACALCRAVCPVIYRATCCHAFCARCREDLSRTRSAALLCPVDGTETWTERIVPDDTVWNSLKDFTVLCTQSVNGCRFSDSLAALKNHIKDCPYIKKMCPLCEEEVLSKDLFNHLGSVCRKRPLVCEHCGLNFHKELLTDHKAHCSDKIVTCEHCGVDGILLGELSLHYEECERKPWCCTMKEYGCTFEGPRKSLIEHLTFEDHIQYIVTHFKELSVINKEQQEEIGHLNFQLDALTKAVKEGNRRVSTTLTTISRALHAQQEENKKLRAKLDELSRMIEQKTIHPILSTKLDGTTTTHHKIPRDGTIERVTYPRYVEAGLVSRPVSARGTTSAVASSSSRIGRLPSNT
ncbi:TNF receptor-associated factor 5-like [Ornithodoros turicata]